jgi:predicted metal-binding membrane protein
LLGVCGLVFLLSVAATAYFCDRPACCTTVAMPGGWSMSTIWTPSPDHGWTGSFALFVLMWAVMMLAMMLPSLTPALIHFRRDGAAPVDVVRVAGAYFFVWTIFGAIAYPIGAVLAGVAIHHDSIAPAVPLLTAAVLLVAGVVQWTPWKRHHLLCCRAARPCEMERAGAWRTGIKLGVHCAQCCLAIMTFMLLAGSMEWRVMLVVTIVITLERVAPRPATVARLTGTIMIVAAAYLACIHA